MPGLLEVPAGMAAEHPGGGRTVLACRSRNAQGCYVFCRDTPNQDTTSPRPPLPKERSWLRMQSTHERFLGWKCLSKSLQDGFLSQYRCAGVGPAASSHTVPPRATSHLCVARGLLRGVTGAWHPLEQRLSELRELLLAATPASFVLTGPLVYENVKTFLLVFALSFS